MQDINQVVNLLSKFNEMLLRLDQRVSDLEAFVWDEPLVSMDDESINPLDENEKIQILKEQLGLVNLEITNLLNVGANVVQFRKA